MIDRFGRFGTALIVLVVLQTLVLGWLVASRIALLRSPDTVTLATEPVDPRDLFRGDYVTLTYGITRLTIGELPGDRDFSRGDAIHVELAPTGATWQAVGVWHDYPKPAGRNKVIRGRVTYVARNTGPLSGSDEETPCNGCVTATVVYGIESYFVPEGHGRDIEGARNARQLSVDVSLAGDGEAAIKGLRLDGELLYEEPLL